MECLAFLGFVGVVAWVVFPALLTPALGVWRVLPPGLRFLAQLLFFGVLGLPLWPVWGPWAWAGAWVAGVVAARLGAQLAHPRARRTPERPRSDPWERAPQMAAALEALAGRLGSGLTRRGPTRLLRDAAGGLLIEARPLRGGLVGLKLRVDAGLGGRSLVLTPEAWEARRRSGAPPTARLARLGERAPARVDALLAEPGVRRLVVAPGRLVLELALDPARPAEQLATHLGALRDALLELAGNPLPITARDEAEDELPTGRCPFCHDGLATEPLELARCGRCGTTHHAECWEEARGCTVLGCGARLAARVRVG